MSFKDERAIQRQLSKVLLPMIGVPDGGMAVLLYTFIVISHTKKKVNHLTMFENVDVQIWRTTLYSKKYLIIYIYRPL